MEDLIFFIIVWQIFGFLYLNIKLRICDGETWLGMALSIFICGPILIFLGIVVILCEIKPFLKEEIF